MSVVQYISFSKWSYSLRSLCCDFFGYGRLFLVFGVLFFGAGVLSVSIFFCLVIERGFLIVVILGVFVFLCVVYSQSGLG